MTEKSKDRVVTLTGSLITSIIVVIIGFSLTSKRADSKELEIKINSKVDRVDFNKKCEQVDLRITTLETSQNETLKKISETMQQMATQNASMQTDIVWIKRELERNNK